MSADVAHQWLDTEPDLSTVFDSEKDNPAVSYLTGKDLTLDDVTGLRTGLETGSTPKSAPQRVISVANSSGVKLRRTQSDTEENWLVPCSDENINRPATAGQIELRPQTSNRKPSNVEAPVKLHQRSASSSKIGPSKKTAKSASERKSHDKADREVRKSFSESFGNAYSMLDKANSTSTSDDLKKKKDLATPRPRSRSITRDLVTSPQQPTPEVARPPSSRRTASQSSVTTEPKPRTVRTTRGSVAETPRRRSYSDVGASTEQKHLATDVLKASTSASRKSPRDYVKHTPRKSISELVREQPQTSIPLDGKLSPRSSLAERQQPKRTPRTPRTRSVDDVKLTPGSQTPRRSLPGSYTPRRSLSESRSGSTAPRMGELHVSSRTIPQPRTKGSSTPRRNLSSENLQPLTSRSTAASASSRVNTPRTSRGTTPRAVTPRSLTASRSPRDNASKGPSFDLYTSRPDFLTYARISHRIGNKNLQGVGILPTPPKKEIYSARSSRPNSAGEELGGLAVRLQTPPRPPTAEQVSHKADTTPPTTDPVVTTKLSVHIPEKGDLAAGQDSARAGTDLLQGKVSPTSAKSKQSTPVHGCKPGKGGVHVAFGRTVAPDKCEACKRILEASAAQDDVDAAQVEAPEVVVVTATPETEPRAEPVMPAVAERKVEPAPEPAEKSVLSMFRKSKKKQKRSAGKGKPKGCGCAVM